MTYEEMVKVLEKESRIIRKHLVKVKANQDRIDALFRPILKEMREARKAK